MSKILEGIRVIDFGAIQVGPYASAMLGELGAEVIKIEEPGVGDHLRGMTHMLGKSALGAGGRNLLFEQTNHKKKGIALNLKKVEGRKTLYKLIGKSDVFVTNYREKSLKEMGLDYDNLHQYNPRLIYACSTPYGTKGPDKDLPAVDMTVNGRSGIMMQSGEEGMPPIFMPPGAGDTLTSIMMAYGVVAALFGRERLGIGQRVDVSILGSLMNLQIYALTFMFMMGIPIPRHNRYTNRNPLYSFYKCKDDRWIVLGTYQSERHFPPLCQQIGKPELATAPRFLDEPRRGDNAEALVAILDEVFASKTSSEWLEILGRADLLVSPIQHYTELETDPQVIANDYVFTWDNPVMGPMKCVGFPVKFSQTPAEYTSAAPELGQHTEEVLQDILGYDWNDITKLQDEGIL